MSATWIAFARHGIPDNAAIPAWPPYTTEQRATMILDTACRVVHDPDREMRLLWTQVVSNT
jgi:para-nitrobenzyl esterase